MNETIEQKKYIVFDINNIKLMNRISNIINEMLNIDDMSNDLQSIIDANVINIINEIINANIKYKLNDCLYVTT